MLFIHTIVTAVSLLAIVNSSENQDIDGATEASTPDGKVDNMRFRDGGSRNTFRSRSGYRMSSKQSPPRHPLLRRSLSRQLSRRSPPRHPGYPKRAPSGSYEKYKDVVPKGRYISGSSHYSSDNWRDFSFNIYGADDFIKNREDKFIRHSSRQNGDIFLPTICTNNEKLFNKGFTLVNFICPFDDLPDSDQFCCGPEKQEFCCNYTDAQYYYGKEQEEEEDRWPMWMYFVIAVAVALGVGVCMCAIVWGLVVCGLCGHQGHVVGRRPPQPVYTQPGQPQPMYTQPGQPQPMYTQGQPQPMYTQGQPQPMYTQPGQPQPMYTQQGQPQPMYTQQGQPQPMYTQGQPQPMNIQPGSYMSGMGNSTQSV